VTDLRFIGDWKLWAALSLALTLAAAAWSLYWRETRPRKDFLRWLLPSLRAVVVFLVVLMLAGPVLHHSRLIDDLARVLVFVDASESMNITDQEMDLPRKLFAAQQLGWLDASNFDSELRAADVALNHAQQIAASARPEMKSAELQMLASNLVTKAEAAAKHLDKVSPANWPSVAERAIRLRNELLTPAQKLVQQNTRLDAETMAGDFQAIAGIASRWGQEVGGKLSEAAYRLQAAKDSAVLAAVKKFDTTPRWQRAEGYLLGGAQPVLGRFAGKHAVELSALAGVKPQLIWWPRDSKPESIKPPLNFGLSPTNRSTDLNTPVRLRLEEVKAAERAAVVLLSDGQHNAGSSPVEFAKVLGHRGVPIFTVGLGPQQPPQDLAVLGLKAPDSVFADARVRGEIQLKDDVRPGLPFKLKIEHENRTLWDKQFITEQKHLRTVAFDFSVKELVADLLRQQGRELKYSSLPLNLKVSATVIGGEKDAGNNTGFLRLSAVTQKPKLLLLDGRPRWEYRYLRNLFERDQRWEVNALLAGAGGEQKPWVRGNQLGKFPADREALFTYQLICIGDLPQNQLRREELEWMKEFVERRAGGIIFVDGRQEQLANFAATPLGQLLPVKWSGTPLGDKPMKLGLKATGPSLAPFALLSDPVENARLWASLPAPHWAAPAVALPGAETLIELTSDDRTAAAFVSRRFGAGRVLYASFDESWRWRYNVGDLYHQKFWNQISRWIMEPPFQVEDRYVSLDSGALTYQPGDTAELRVRVRDAQGRPRLDAKVEAQLLRAGVRVATVPLTGDDNSGGIYRGRTAALTDGDYEVRVQVDGLAGSEVKVKAAFTVEPQGGGEMAQLNCDEDLLRQMAFHSGGQYYREEELADLVERLRPLSQGKLIESETALWQSYWWFAPIVLFLTVEWVLRKRAGLM
jgi:hypothetical protein